MVEKIHRSGFQAALHVMEIRSAKVALAATEGALGIFPKPDHRHRLEHCSLCPPEIAERLAALGVMVVTMPAFLYYHGSRYLRTIPVEEIPFLYPLGTLRRHEVHLAAGSDSPMAPINPLMGIYGAAFRKTETQEIVCRRENRYFGGTQALHNLRSRSVF